MNNPTSTVPSLLSYLSCVLPNMKNNAVTNSINAISIPISGLIAIGLIALLAPKTSEMLKMFEPITLPMIN